MDKTAIKNRIHALLHQRLIAAPVKDVFSGPSRTWLQTLTLDTDGQQALASDLRLLEAVEEEITQQEKELAQAGYADLQVKLLLTLPGVDLTVAQSCSRLWVTSPASGMVPMRPVTSASCPLPNSPRRGCYHGPITRQGNGHARAMLVQAAQRVGAHPGPTGGFLRRLSTRKNRSVAVVATARKLVVNAWQMLRNQEPYRYAQPATTQLKFDRLRLKATGEKQKCRARPGTTRTATYGSGEHSRPRSAGMMGPGAYCPPSSIPPVTSKMRVLRLGALHLRPLSMSGGFMLNFLITLRVLSVSSRVADITEIYYLHFNSVTIGLGKEITVGEKSSGSLPAADT